MLKRIEKGLYRVCQIVTSIAMVMMVILTVAEIIVRGVFNSSLLISDEVCGYLMVVLAFWGAVNAFVDDEFVRVDALFEKFSPSVKRMMTFLFTLLFAAVNGLICRHIWANAMKSVTRWDRSATVARLPLAYPKLAMAIGITLLEFIIVIRILEFITGEDKKGKEEKAS